MSKVQTGYKSTELGDIPEGWEIVSLADVADPNKPYALTGGPFGSDLKSEEYTESGVRIIQLQNIKEGYFSNDYKIYTSEAKANQLFNSNIFPNDIIIAKMAEPVARACIIPNLHERYLMASDGIRLAVNEENYSTKYVMYAINSSYFRQQAIDNSTGTTRLRIGLKTLKGLKLLKPSKGEQKKISSILSSIDEIIEKTETIIEQTEEVKKGLMQQLLTKGIGHTKFKKTEIGEIPEEWDMKQLGKVAEIKGRIGWKGYTKEDLRQSGPLVLGATQINSRYKLDLTNPVYLSQEKYEESPEIMVSMGDIIVVQRGSTIGKVALIDKQLGEATINPSMVLLKNIQINSVFLYLFLSSEFVQKRLAADTSQTSIPMISQKQISGISIGIPPYDEQCKIADIIQSIDGKISAEERKLSKLRTLKKGLMQSLLTGKVLVKVDEAEVTQV